MKIIILVLFGAHVQMQNFFRKIAPKFIKIHMHLFSEKNKKSVFFQVSKVGGSY